MTLICVDYVVFNQEGEFRKMNGMTLGSVPKARPVPVYGKNRRSGSDMDLDSDSDDENYGGRYSVESSPQDDKIRRGFEQKHFVSDQVGLLVLHYF